MSDTVEIPINPPKGLLISMALRYDHALGCPGYYDQPIFSNCGSSHKERLYSTILLMGQLYEEVVGRGFYKPELEEKYKGIIKTNE